MLRESIRSVSGPGNADQRERIPKDGSEVWWQNITCEAFYLVAVACKDSNLNLCSRHD